jgi:hypothetical protein
MASRSGSIRRHHVVGAGLLASAAGAYHIASQYGLFPSVTRGPIADFVNQVEALAGHPVSHNDSYLAPNMPNGDNDSSPISGLTGGDIQVYFSPQGGCTTAIVNELNQARSIILVQAYSFTSKEIAEACVQAHARGVAVYAVLDKSQETEPYSAADFMVNSGIPTVIDSKHAIAHNKVILIDGLTIITGSFNFTKNAEQSNAENLLVIKNRPDLYAVYQENIKHHYEHSAQHYPHGTGPGSTQGNNYQRTR